MMQRKREPKMKTLHPHLSRSQILLIVKVGAIILTALAFYWQDLIILANEAIQSEFMAHILAIPFLFAYLLYRKRKMLRAVIPFETTETKSQKIIFSNVTIGAILYLLAILIYWYGSYTFIPLEYHMASLVIFVIGCVLIMFNTFTLRVLAFPIAFLIFLMPPPLEIIYTLGSTMSIVSSQAAYTILKTIGLPVSLMQQYETPMIILEKTNSPPLTFAVDIACSGIYSLIGFLIFAIFIAYISKGHPWKKATTFLIGFPLIYALNILRITIIVLIGNQYGMELAMQIFHLLGGWVLIFLGTLLLLTISEKILKTTIFTTKTKTNPCPRCTSQKQENRSFCVACGTLLKNSEIRLQKQDLAKIMALFATVILLLLIQTPVFALTQGPAEVILQTPAGQQITTAILPEIPGYTSRFVYRDTRFEQIAKQDASLTYAYTSTSDNPKETIWVTIEIAKSKYNLHRWETCLITWPQSLGRQPEVTQLDLRDVELLQNPPVIGRYFAFQSIKTNQTQVVLYWYESATFQTNSTSQQEYVKIGLIAFPETPENIQEIEDKMLPFAKAIVNHWQPIKTWSQIALALSQNGPTLIAITALILTTITTAWIIQQIIQRKTNQKAYLKLSEKDKQILLAVKEANRNHEGTTQEIAIVYKQTIEEKIKLTTLHEALNNIKEVGLIKQTIANENDQPILKWKTNILIP
jgi:exosortase